MKNGNHRLLFMIGLALALFLALSAGGSVNGSAAPTPEEELAEGLALFQKNEHVQALKTFRRLEEKYPIHPLRPDFIFMQGHTLRALKEWSEAAQAFFRASEVHSTLADYALYHQGEALQLAGERAKSLMVLERLITLHPQSLAVPQAELKMVEFHFQSAEYLRAAEVCENLLKKNLRKDYPAQALILLGQIRESLGQWGGAIKTYQEIWLKYPLHSAAQKAKARRDSLVKEKRLSLEPIPPEALLRRALQFYLARLYESALDEMERIEGFRRQGYPAGYPGERWVDDLYFHRGMCLFRLKRYAKAAENFNWITRHSRNEETVDKAFFWTIQTFYRMGRKEEALSAFSLFQKVYPHSLFMDRALYLKAQIFEDRGEPLQAVALYQELAEQFPKSSLRLPAIWQSGWIGYKGNDFSGAIQAWDRLKSMSPNSFWAEKALYWKGRALEKLGKTQEAEEHHLQILKTFPASYYSRLAEARGRFFITGRGFAIPLQDHRLTPFSGLKGQSEGPANPHIEKGEALARLGFLTAATEELEAAEEEGRPAEQMRLEISRLYREVGEYHRSALLVRKSFSLKPLPAHLPENDRVLFLLAYPLGNSSWLNLFAKERNLDPTLLSAVILEESRFNPQALSRAGARGLMQIMPGTGQQIARRLKIQPFSNGLLFDSEMNLRLGSWYLGNLLAEFKGQEALALAAYNAGPQVVREWMAKNPSAREDEFVEDIPYAETRNYVIRVLGSAGVYRLLYSPPKNPDKP